MTPLVLSLLLAQWHAGGGTVGPRGPAGPQGDPGLASTVVSSLDHDPANCVTSGWAAQGIAADGAAQGCFQPAGGPGATPGGSSGNLQTNSGAGGFSAYGGASCAYAVKTLDASGSPTCTAAPTIPAFPLSAANGGLGQAQPTCSAGYYLSCNGTTCSCSNAAVASATSATSASSATSATTAGALSSTSQCSAGTAPTGITTAGAATGCTSYLQSYAPTDATGAAKGVLQLAGDLGGTAASPAVPGLAGKEPTITTLTQAKGGTGAGALTCSGGQHLTSNGTAYSCSADTAYTLPAASTTLGGVKQASACAAGSHVSSIGAAGELTCTADAGGTGAPTTSQYWVGAADGLLSAEKDLSGFTGIVLNTAGTPSAAAAGDLPGGPYLTSVTAHTLMGATHSDVDTAAATGGDLLVRNSGNTQWTHQPTGTANQVLHGGTNVVAWGPVDLSADTAATVLPMAKGGTGANLTGTVGALLYPTSSTVVGQLADVAVGSTLVSGGVGAAPAWSAASTCTSSAATTCTIASQRSGCKPVCSMTTSVSTTFRAAISTTTITCTFGTSGTNTCNCVCF